MQKVRDYLRTYGVDVWTDEGLHPGTRNWQVAIEEAIRGCKGIVVILSPDAISSVWVREELSFARNVGKPIFPLLARGSSKDAIPFGFSAAQWIDIRKDVGAGLRSYPLSSSIAAGSNNQGDFLERKNKNPVLYKTAKDPEKMGRSSQKRRGVAGGLGYLLFLL
jgi:hypothetical protein